MTVDQDAPTRSPEPGRRPRREPALPAWTTEWTTGPAHAPAEIGMWDLVRAQAARTPQAVAVRQWDSRLTYRELVYSAAALAARLRNLGAGPEARVGICVRRGLLLPVSVLGVLASGAAYVALDPSHPRRRLNQVLDDAEIDVVVADQAGRSLLADARRRLVTPSFTESGPAPAACPARPLNPAYLLYTSGSTGRPKGVAVSHHSLSCFVTATADHFELNSKTRSIAFSALGFDVSVLDMLTPLTRGGAVQVVPDADRIDPVRLQRFLEAHDVSFGFVPPALLPLLDPARLPHLRDVVTAGEPPGPEQVARWSAPPHRRLHNWYGPTETTVCVVGCELTGRWDRPVPIGTPLAGCRAYILDEQMRPCPPGTPGELYIGGPQLARGYHARPSLTAQRFVPDPFGDQPGGRLYRTGDRVAWQPDGRIGFLGRLDRQVKVQGQRVEIGEVESVLRGHPRVLQAIVDISDHDRELVAFLTPADTPHVAELREYCAERLPGYMIPTRVVRLGTLPLTASGKADLPELHALAARDGSRQSARQREPSASNGSGSVEAVVARVWTEVLSLPEPRPEQDFLDCGGHSLRAMRLASAIRAALHRDIAVADVYAGRTLAGLVTRVRAAPTLGDTATLRVGNPPALSAAQRRMWFVEHLAPDTPAHNIALAERIRGPLDIAALNSALRFVAARHQPLRWRVPQQDGVPHVVVEEPGETPLRTVDLSADLAPETALRDLLNAEALARFDLATGPLWRVTLVRLSADHHVLAISVHHLVFDGWSQDVLYRDIAAGYDLAQAGAGRPPAGLPAEFGDYVAALAERSARQGTERLRWWTDRLADFPTVVDLPRDQARPTVQTFRGATLHTEIDPATTSAVRDLARRLDTTMYPVLLAGFGQLLRRLTGQHEMIVGTPYADRDHVAFEPLIGLLLQILPVRLRVDDRVSFADHVRDCRDEVDEAVAHRDVPLERVVEALRIPRDPGRNPLIQMLFNMHNFAVPRLELPGCHVTPVRAGLPGSLFDLTLYLSEHGDTLRVQAVYNPDLYHRERVAGYLDSYRHLLAQLVAAPGEPVRAARARPPGSRLGDWTSPLPIRQAPGLVEQITRMTAERPDAVAIAGAGGRLSYREFEQLRCRTTVAVRAAGVTPGEAVAVLATRDVTLPALLIGVLASGARWAVLDSSLPATRLAEQAAAADARALLLAPGAKRPAELRHLSVVPTLADGDSTPTLAARREYLSFTSGSTGQPKPVVSPEAPLSGFLSWYADRFELTPDDRFALLAGLSHDPLLRDAFTPLTLGAQLAVPRQEWLRDPARLGVWLRDQQITVAHLTPQLGRMLTTGRSGGPLTGLRLVVVAGDQLTTADVSRLRVLAPHARLVNGYGTTETPQVHAWHEPSGQEQGDVVPVGHGVPGSQLVVIDPLGRPAAMGELGDVVIRSRHLATGYLDAALTRARFRPTPGVIDPLDRFHRTGDLGRHLPDGTVVLAGRVDDQVKVRGYRVELGEVEAAIAGHPDVRAAAAVAAAGTIQGFIAPAQPDLRVTDLLGYLRTRLPEYAMPSELRLVPAIPLTPNGKLDRRALLRTVPPPAPKPTDAELRTGTERLVAGIWRSVLGRPRVAAEDNFFDVGGHSLALVTVAARLSAAAGREIPVVELFRYPTVRALASFLDGDGSSPGLDRAARRVAVRRERSRRRSPSRAIGATSTLEGVTDDASQS